MAKRARPSASPRRPPASASPRRQPKRTKPMSRVQQRDFRFFINAVSDYAIFMLDTTGRITTWNAGAEKIKGYKQHEIIGQHLSKFYPSEDRAAGKPKRALALARKTGRYEEDGYRVRKDGTRFWASVILDAVYDRAGTHLGFVKITRDITERRLAQESGRKAREEVFQSQKMETLGHVTGGIAHDFNNYLTVILGNLEIARSLISRGQKEDSGRLERAISSALVGVDRAAALTRSLLAFSRREPTEAGLINVQHALSSITDLLRSSVGESIQLNMELNARGGHVEADAAQLETAVLNLAVNARDAMPDGGSLTIRAFTVSLDAAYSTGHADMRSGPHVVIEVSDTGAGMTDDVLEHAFEPFFTTKPPGAGTGLGLSQVYGFVKQSQGHLTVSSAVGRGATFRILLPQVQGSALTETSSVAIPPRGNQNETILVVEDNADVRAYLVDMLGELGYRVLHAHDSATTLAQLSSGGANVRLMLVDIVLGRARGSQVATAARAIYPDLKVLFMTGRLAPIHESEAQPAEVIHKPFTQNELAARLRQLLDGGQQDR